jgi:hypothetical protein
VALGGKVRLLPGPPSTLEQQPVAAQLGHATQRQNIERRLTRRLRVLSA